MGKYDFVDPRDPCFDIPAALDRRGETVQVPKSGRAKRTFVMPSQRRIKAAKRKREQEAARAKRALERDLALGVKPDVVDTAAELTRKVTK